MYCVDVFVFFCLVLFFYASGVVFFFFFKQKTAYELRISDWSSDVCSSDLGSGEIGFITAQIKDVAQARVGDTVTDAKRPAAAPLAGFKEVQPVVFCGLFPTDANDFEKLRESIQKLRLNDASFRFAMETSAADRTSVV